ncbi:MAG: ATP-dependent RNA helicase HrpA [Planctomycetaceae bacterium]
MSNRWDEYYSQLDETMLADRYRLRRMLRDLSHTGKQRNPPVQRLREFETLLERSREWARQRRELLPVPRFSGTLPIDDRIEEIKSAIHSHQVIILCGETGSGKSTQLPKICLSLGRGVHGLIGHTQPRRLAARSVAARIAEELGSPLGEQVGFKIRFTDTTRPHTFIKLMTDGILLAETQGDRFLEAYDTLIIDEAHERSLNIDFLLGYIQRLLPRRPELRLIITSATIDAARFSEHFSLGGQPAPVLEVSGRTFPVELRYRPPVADEDSDEPDWKSAFTAAVDELSREKRGDILAFLPTEREIREAAKLLRGHLTRTRGSESALEVLPLYGRLSEKEQQRIFQPLPRQRIVLATNVAESSLTVPNIECVIDLGTARISRYSPRAQIQRLPIEPISQASAKQRLGRCGRIAPGICVRLYDEKDFLGREEFTPPEIQRTNLAQVILRTLSLKLGPIEEFPFLDPPRGGMIRDGYKTLHELGAIDDQQKLTEIGQQLARLPVDPRIGRIILAGHEENCLHEILIIASGLEVQDPRDRPVEFQQAADQAHRQFQHESSDFLGLLKLWDFHHHLKLELSQAKYKLACRKNFLSVSRLREWSEVHRQLLQLVQEARLPVQARRNNEDAIHRALLTGFLANVAFLDDKNEYAGSGGLKRYLWPGSGLFAKKPKWIMSAEVVETSQRYARMVARINPAWIEPLARHLVKLSHAEPHWDKQAGCVMAWEKVTLFGMTIVPRRRVNYGGVDPVQARELMIRDGLATFEFESPGEFLVHNLCLVEEVRNMQAKVRRADFGAIEQIIIDFYDARIPAECYDAARFEKWRKQIEQEQPRVLFFETEMFLPPQEQTLDRHLFPDALVFENLQLPLAYQLQPGEEEDGVTLTVSREHLHELQPGLLDWLVPGLVEEKIAALIKTLPKSLRTLLIPAPDTAREVNRQITFGQGPFLQTIALPLQRIAGEPIPLEAFDLPALPEHLRMNIKVTDEEGRVLAVGRDLERLRQQFRTGVEQRGSTDAPLPASSGPSLAELAPRTRWHKDGITRWEFPKFPAAVELKFHQYVLTGYPSLVDAGSSVQLRLREQADVALRETRQGVFRLFQLEAREKILAQLKWFPDIEQLDLLSTVHPGFKHIRGQLSELIARHAFPQEFPLPRDEAEFKSLVKSGIQQLPASVQEVARVVGPIVPLSRLLHKQIEDLNAPSWSYARADLRNQLEGLIAPRFLLDTPWPWLTQFPRFLQGMQVRLEKLRSGQLDRDQRAAEQLAPYVRRLHEGNPVLRRLDPEWVEFRWLVEEYRVSLFAQQLGTSRQVSPKRLDRQWKKAARFT